MSARVGTTKITENIYKAIKMLIEAGATYQECAEYMNVSLTSVGRVARSENYEDYRNGINAYYYGKKKAAEKAEEEKKEAERKAAEEAAKKAEEKKLPPQSPPIVLPQHRPLSGDSGYQLQQLMKEQNEYLRIISNKLAFIVDELCGPVKKEG